MKGRRGRLVAATRGEGKHVSEAGRLRRSGRVLLPPIICISNIVCTATVLLHG